MKRLFPTLWRYFLSQYLKVLLLSLFAFVIILLSTKLQDFAHFVSMGAPLPLVGLFVLYQIPYVMQIAIPISSLIATLYLFQRLSANNALSAARASGISLFGLITPILLCSIFLSLFTFRYVLDLSATCHRASKELEMELKKLHPLAIFHNTKLLEQSGMNIEMEGSLEHDKQASHFVLAVRYGEKGDLALYIARKMRLEGDIIHGQNIALITTRPAEAAEGFDHLIIENAKKNQVSLQDLALLVNTKRFRLGNDDLSFALLRAKKNDFVNRLHEAEFLSEKIRYTRQQLARIYSEMARRISLALSIVSFSLLGMAYGMTLGRIQIKKRLLPVVFFTAFFLICYLGGKAMEGSAPISVTLYLIPHAVLIAAAIRRLKRIQNGYEG